MFRDLGMHNNVSTRIKCLNCESGDHAPDFHPNDGAAFATKLKMEMCQRQYGNVRVFGYVGSLVLLGNPAFGIERTKVAIMPNDAANAVRGTKAFRGKDLRFEVTQDYATNLGRADVIHQLTRAFAGDTGIPMDVT